MSRRFFFIWKKNAHCYTFKDSVPWVQGCCRLTYTGSRVKILMQLRLRLRLLSYYTKPTFLKQAKVNIRVRASFSPLFWFKLNRKSKKCHFFVTFLIIYPWHTAGLEPERYYQNDAAPFSATLVAMQSYNMLKCLITKQVYDK
jgi:hypothetical protein